MSPIQGGIVLVQARAVSYYQYCPPMSSSSKAKASAVTFTAFALYGFICLVDNHKGGKVTGHSHVRHWRNSELWGGIWYVNIYAT